MLLHDEATQFARFPGRPMRQVNHSCSLFCQVRGLQLAPVTQTDADSIETLPHRLSCRCEEAVEIKVHLVS